MCPAPPYMSALIGFTRAFAICPSWPVRPISLMGAQMQRKIRMDIFIAAVFALALVAGEPGAPQLNAATNIGNLDGKVIRESSGLIKSPRHEGVFWTHSDSGDKARIFAIDRNGKLLREVTVDGAVNYDWEEICADEQGRLLIADIGDNKRDRKHLTLYRVAEPNLDKAGANKVRAEEFEFQYPQNEKPHDAEAMVWRSGHAYLFSKETEGTRLYKIALPEKGQGKHCVCNLVASTGKVNLLTGAALNEDGTRLAVVNYLSVSVYDLAQPLEKLSADELAKIFDAPRRVRVGWLGQVEAVAWDGADLMLTNESGQVYRIDKADK